MHLLSSLFTTQSRNISYKKVLSWYSGLLKPKKNSPPYTHVTQIGDPCLRAKANVVPKENIGSEEIIAVIKRMKEVFKKYNCAGLSASQIGIPVKIIMLEFNDKHLKSYTEKERQIFEMSLLPFTVVINPELKVVDYSKLIFAESCESIKGFCADVSRFKAVELTGLNVNGDSLNLKASGWSARIIQHEMDHIDGQLYTDIMIRNTLVCPVWEVVNERRGRVELPYSAD